MGTPEGDGLEALCARGRRMAPLDPARALLLAFDAIELLGIQHRRIIEIVTAAAVAAGALAPPPDYDPDPDPGPVAAQVVQLHLDGDDYIAVASRPVTPATVASLRRFLDEHKPAAGEGG
jgi:hypothetical protein